jgi:hypothetical protein
MNIDKPYTTLTQDQYTDVLLALAINVARGHFQEGYEGFNDCPAAAHDSGFPELDGRCNCGLTQANMALEKLDSEDVAHAMRLADEAASRIKGMVR